MCICCLWAPKWRLLREVWKSCQNDDFCLKNVKKLSKWRLLREKVAKMMTFVWKSHQIVSVKMSPKWRLLLIFIEALKMAENHEKPCFTFFAFLPPYIGVSGSLVSGMRKISMRSIDWYQKFLISWLAARYSTVFVFSLWKNIVESPSKIYFKSMKIYENPWTSMKIY